MRHWLEMAEQNERSFVHRELDLTGVPRHGTTAPADTSPVRTPEGEGDGKVQRRSGVLAGPGTDPWWRRLLQRARR